MEAQPGIEITDPSAYRKKLVNALDGRDPVEIMSQTADVLQRVVDEQPRERMSMRPYEGKWTPTEILGHLVDVELVFGSRLRAVLCEDKPQIIGIDQERWVTGQRYNECEPRELVESFRSLRSINLRLWRQLVESDLQRVGLHNERGEETLSTMRLMLAGHDVSHIDQIKRYLDACEQAER